MKKMQKAKRGMGVTVAIGIAVCLIVMLTGIAISAALIIASRIPPSAEAYCAMVLLLLSSFLGTVVALRNLENRRLLAGILITAASFLILLGITAVWFEGQYQGVGATGLVILCGGIIGIFLGTKDKKRSISRKSKIKHRQFVQNVSGR